MYEIISNSHCHNKKQYVNFRLHFKNSIETGAYLLFFCFFTHSSYSFASCLLNTVLDKITSSHNLLAYPVSLNKKIIQTQYKHKFKSM